MKEDIDINYFIKLFLEQKKIIFIIVAAAVTISVIYALTATKYYKAYAYILPPQTKYVQALNVVDADGYRFCVDTHTTGFVVKACKWDGSACTGTEADTLTLNTKGANNF